MATDMVRVKPWPGLILDGIPPAGADIPRALAEEWIDNHLVLAVRPTAIHGTDYFAVAETKTTAPKAGRAPKAPANRQKRRRTR